MREPTPLVHPRANSQSAVIEQDPTRAGSGQPEIIEDPIGTDVCDAAHPGCFIIVNDASSTDPRDSAALTRSDPG